MNSQKKGFLLFLCEFHKKDEIHEIGKVWDFYQQVKKEVLKE